MIRTALDQALKMPLICGFSSGSAMDRAMLSLIPFVRLSAGDRLCLMKSGFRVLREVLGMLVWRIAVLGRR